ncbi:hypothetical protein ACIN8IBEIGE_160152 [Acinetobacter sp. 8I-beige]|nr:hypothetical protein ACIN8IBEIGE_160152 [Acinetobacter sp. 8I-beige]
MKNAYIIDAIRTPFGRYAGGLAPIRADDLGAVPIQALMQRNPSVDWTQVDDVMAHHSMRLPWQRVRLKQVKPI